MFVLAHPPTVGDVSVILGRLCIAANDTGGPTDHSARRGQRCKVPMPRQTLVHLCSPFPQNRRLSWLPIHDVLVTQLGEVAAASGEARLYPGPLCHRGRPQTQRVSVQVSASLHCSELLRPVGGTCCTRGTHRPSAQVGDKAK
jgi:hypothetical protein